MKSLFARACLFVGLSAGLFAGLSRPAWSVTCTSDTSDGLNYFVATTSTFDPPTFDPGSVPIGGIIYAANGYPNFLNVRRSRASTSCDRIIDTYVTGVGVPSDHIYPTTIPGIGIRVSSAGRQAPFHDRTSYSAFDSASGRYESWWNQQFPVRIELIKTGNITEGGVLTGAYAQYRADSQDGQVLVEYRFASPVPVQPKVPTCKVATPVISVPLGAVMRAQLTGVGATTPLRPFEIALNCSGGDAGTSTRAYVTLTDATVSTNTSRVLSLTKDSTASGIGVEILLHDDTLLGFGPDSMAGGNLNQWPAGTIVQGQTALRIPLSAHYIQTKPLVTPGSANARATFTLNYQ